MHQSSCIQVTRMVKALLKWPLLLHTSNSLLGGRGWTGFINDLERYPHCDWLKTSYSANKVTFCKYAARLHLYKMYPCSGTKRFSPNHSAKQKANVPDDCWSPFRSELLVWSWLGVKSTYSGLPLLERKQPLGTCVLMCLHKCSTQAHHAVQKLLHEMVSAVLREATASCTVAKRMVCQKISKCVSRAVFFNNFCITDHFMQ